MTDTIDGGAPGGKRRVAGEGRDGDAADAVQLPAPTPVAALADAAAAVRRLARAQAVPQALLAALDGTLGGAIATAAGYAGWTLPCQATRP